MINIILVPQGAEHQVVCKGINGAHNAKIQVIGIPIGISSLKPFLKNNYPHWNPYLNRQVLLMGLCGSLHPDYGVGNIVLYETCIYETNQVNQINCDVNLTKDIYKHLKDQAFLVRGVKGITSDTVVSKSVEKGGLHRKFGVDVVDMEGFGFLEFFQGTGISTAILRVVSDDSTHNIPDLSKTINPNGSLEILPLLIALTQQPIAASHLISGSLRGLKQLEKLARCLATWQQ
ncbi:phosphorylase [Cylindrospermopsis raciborskii]|uniref:5'-methylthioadenosine/S-adenosylhomocysteine nucleosidase family protein n=1 Tax=Cylindrospermopsis raciborskii TaxID=77022 RepID=UPI00114455B5|nr:phosphorylase [Cylindrospermopsis raciborskii]TPX28476.1 phosphorylase [Cylindrospermopsis raciborskii GIHE 2018]